jgi:hypothetical protein
LSHFRFAEIKVLPPSSWRQASIHRILAFDYSNPALPSKKDPPRMGWIFFGGGEGI